MSRQTMVTDFPYSGCRRAAGMCISSRCNVNTPRRCGESAASTSKQRRLDPFGGRRALESRIESPKAPEWGVTSPLGMEGRPSIPNGGVVMAHDTAVELKLGMANPGFCWHSREATSSRAAWVGLYRGTGKGRAEQHGWMVGFSFVYQRVHIGNL